MTQELTTRPLRAGDEPLLVRATLGNLNWREERFTEDDVRRRPEFRHYTQLVPDRGDFGLVVERGGEPIGVAWALLLPKDEPGYGFLDESTPEISLWVRQDARGTGNRARQLYLSKGFAQTGEPEDAGVMVWVS